jgi:membrane protease YdiL (CAAX protease family)
MNGADLPPESPPAVFREPVSRWRWGFHFILLALYPITLGVLPSFVSHDDSTMLLPNETMGLLAVAAAELAIFALIFLAAWAASRASLDQLLLRGWHGGQPVWRGLLYSIALRLVIALVAIAVVVALALAGGAPTEIAEKLRPRTEAVVDPTTLTGDPIYFGLMLTLVSFVVGGFREELWRAGMLAGWNALFPPSRPGILGQFLGVLVAALIFGIGHLPQGMGGAAATGLLGLGLGFIMVRHRSIWEAVFAHGFFNATTFLMLYWLARYHPTMMPVQ